MRRRDRRLVAHARAVVDQAEPAWGYWPSQRHANQAQLLGVQTTTLDAAGGAQLTLQDLPLRDAAQILTAELEYADPNGEILTAATRVPLWPAQIVLGIKPDGWAMSQVTRAMPTAMCGWAGARTGGSAPITRIAWRCFPSAVITSRGRPRACRCGCRFGPRPRWSLSSVKALFSALSHPVWSFTRH